MLSASQIVAQLRRGERTVRDTVHGSLITTEGQQERLNTATLIDAERALVRADELDEAGDTGGPLAGVPIALKDIIDHTGRPTTCGSSFYAPVPERSATVVDRLEAAGAVVVSRTNLHEFAYGFSSENPWFGAVRNPIDTSTSAGGSSGGSAAAVAAGQVPIAIGTDTGGSVRVPAALCGVYGLKVTHGRIPLTGVFPLAASLDTVGPIASTVGDLALAYQVMAGHDPADPWSAQRPATSPGSPRPDLDGVRIAVPLPWIDDGPTSESVAVAFAEAVANLSALGATVETVTDPVISLSGHLKDLSAAEAASVHRTWFAEGREYGADVRERLEYAMGLDSDDYVAAHAWRVQIQRHFEQLFVAHDLVITPATGVTSKTIGEDMVPVIGGDIFYRTALSYFTALVNVAGNPALVGPLAVDGAPPPALQLIAPHWSEHRLLDVAATLVEHGVMRDPQI
jgi:aspartyl-tRNA(Asn)/glutamyl-tRNA(Gln) amidotransferase subunit A